MRKLASVVTLIVALSVTPALADKPASPHMKPNKCAPHAKRYRAQGTLVVADITANSDKTYSGTLTVHVNHVDAPFKSDKGTDQTYTLDHAKVHMAKNLGALTAGMKVKVTGKRTTLKKKCDQSGFTATTTIKKADVHPAPKPKAGHAA